MEEKILKITGEYIEQVADNGLEDVDIDYLSKIVDIHKTICASQDGSVIF